MRMSQSVGTERGESIQAKCAGREGRPGPLGCLPGERSWSKEEGVRLEMLMWPSGAGFNAI